MIDINNQIGGRVAYYTGSSIIMDKLAVTYPNAALLLVPINYIIENLEIQLRLHYQAYE